MQTWKTGEQDKKSKSCTCLVQHLCVSACGFMLNGKNYSLWTHSVFPWGVCTVFTSSLRDTTKLARRTKEVYDDQKPLKLLILVLDSSGSLLSFYFERQQSDSAFPQHWEQLLFQKGWEVSSGAAPGHKASFFPKITSFPLVDFCRVHSRPTTGPSSWVRSR